MYNFLTNQTSGTFNYNIITFDQYDLDYVKVTLDDTVYNNQSYNFFSYDNLLKDTVHTIKVQPMDLVGNLGRELVHSWYITDTVTPQIDWDYFNPFRTNQSTFYGLLESNCINAFKDVKWKITNNFNDGVLEGVTDIRNMITDSVSGLLPELESIPASGIKFTITASATFYFVESEFSADSWRSAIVRDAHTYTTSYSWYYDPIYPLAYMMSAEGDLLIDTNIANSWSWGSGINTSEANCLTKYKLEKVINDETVLLRPWSRYKANTYVEVVFTSPGVYYLSVRAIDLAGNEQPKDTIKRYRIILHQA